MKRAYTASFPFLALLVFTAGCPDLDTICPYKTISQGVFGEVVNEGGTLEQNVKVDIYTILNGVQGTLVASMQTSRGGYQFNMLPGTYSLCAKSVCTPVTVPEGLIGMSAVDAAAGLTWQAPVTVPPKQMIGPCAFGG